MTLSLLDLVVAPTRDEIQKSWYDALGILGVSTTSWKPGAVPRAIITSGSALLAPFARLISQAIANQYLPWATGNWLLLLAEHVYGYEPEEATFATGQLTLTNSGGGIYVLDPGDYVARNPATDKTYTNVNTVNLGAGQTVTLDVLAEEVGAASTSGPGTIVESVTQLLGVTVTNTFAVVGQDAENEESIRTNCREKLGALSPNGPWDAYSYAARKARRADGSLIGVTKTRIDKDGFGNVTVYCATPTGGLEVSDIADVDSAIQKNAAPLAVTASAATAVPHVVNVFAIVWIYNTTGRTDNQIKAVLTNRILELFASSTSNPIGGNSIGGLNPGKLWRDAVLSQIGDTYEQIFRTNLITPAVDVALGTNEVPVPGTITFSIVQLAPPGGG